MVLILDGSEESGAHIEINEVFRFVEGIFYIEKVVKSDILEKTYFTSYALNMFWATILYKYHDSHSL